MGLVQEFKAFAMRGNVVDMAVGIVIGAAFGKIVSSFVNDVLMPPIGMLIGGVDFSDLQLTLKGAQPPAEAGGEPIAAVTVNYGMFLNTVLDFVIIAFAIFMVIKAMNTLERKKQKQPAPKPPEDTKDQKLLGEIRDLLKTRAS